MSPSPTPQLNFIVYVISTLYLSSYNSDISENMDTNNEENLIKRGDFALHCIIWNMKLRKETGTRISSAFLIVQPYTVVKRKHIRNKIRTVELHFMGRNLQVPEKDKWVIQIVVHRENDSPQVTTEDLEAVTTRLKKQPNQKKGGNWND